MQGDTHGGTKVSVQGRTEGVDDPAALAALCAAVDRAVQAYRPEGLRVREVVVMLEEGSPALGAAEATPVYVDVYDSGYGHGI
ncbi:MAG TPA: hypothetical protein VM820_00325 [Vicinamibacterales bacterium]|jgi:hypothetical protein|nr:hypothetical protein [Vicinamibacterales bacterium]